MISRIIDATVMLGGGLILGWLLVSPAEHPPAQPAQVAVRTAALLVSKPAPAVDKPLVDKTAPLPDCPEPAAQQSAKLPDGNPPLPPVYAEMLGAVAKTATGSQQ